MCEDSVVVGLDPEADVGFFSMSTGQRRTGHRADPDRAGPGLGVHRPGLQRPAFLALGYDSWDEYVDARFGDLRLAVPREHRTQVVATLAGARMSVRAIAKLLGVGVATVHRELVRATTSTEESEGSDGGLPPVLGRDGKTYPRTTRHAPTRCQTCGESHLRGTLDCPWDMFAQGLGPHPSPRNGSNRDTDDDKVPAANGQPNQQPTAPDQQNANTTPERPAQTSVISAGADSDLTDLLKQIESIVADLRRVTPNSTAANPSPRSTTTENLAAEAEREESTRWASLVKALLRLADKLQAQAQHLAADCDATA